MLDVVWISLAFALGLIVRQVSLPPLVGYLIAGFVLSAFGVEADAVIDDLADLGVTLLLFTIGLKLKVKSLARPQVWAVALLHMAVVVALLVPTLLGLGALGVPLLAGLSWGRSTPPSPSASSSCRTLPRCSSWGPPPARCRRPGRSCCWR
jgi:predicted Kef-type K+ transport protein